METIIQYMFPIMPSLTLSIHSMEFCLNDLTISVQSILSKIAN